MLKSVEGMSSPGCSFQEDAMPSSDRTPFMQSNMTELSNDTNDICSSVTSNSTKQSVNRGKKKSESSNDSRKGKKKRTSPPSSTISESITLPINDVPGVALSRAATDCAARITLSSDQLTATGYRGYIMVRCTHGVSDESWYCEALILPPEKLTEGHCRLGWSTRKGELQGPVGYDSHSYGYRDIGGSRIHSSLRHDDYGESFGPGDVIGMQITLNGPPEINGVRFFKNGKDQGIAYRDLPLNEYCPAVSLYKGGCVRMNFGPEFIYPPPPLMPDNSKLFRRTYPRPMSDLKPLSPVHMERQVCWVQEEKLKRTNMADMKSEFVEMEL